MKKPKGNLDLYYYKVQSHAIKTYLTTGTMPIITEWVSGVTYLTVNRMVFYLIPKDAVCLSEKFYVPSKKLFNTDSAVKDLYLGELTKADLTGNQYTTGFNHETVIISFKGKGEQDFYIDQKNLELFPKQKILAFSNKNPSPLFVLSSLNILLGGVWPVNFQKQ